MLRRLAVLIALLLARDAAALSADRVIAGGFEDDELPGATCVATDLTAAEFLARLRDPLDAAIVSTCVPPFAVGGVDVCADAACAGGAAGCPVAAGSGALAIAQRLDRDAVLATRAIGLAAAAGACAMSLSGTLDVEVIYETAPAGLEGGAIEGLEGVIASDAALASGGCADAALEAELRARLRAAASFSVYAAMRGTDLPAVVCPLPPP